MLLLDTCTLLWLTSDQSTLSVRAKELILSNSDGLFISSISAFEISLKHNKGRLNLPLDMKEWWPRALDQHGISEIAINSQIAIGATKLPSLHADPCDRMIIATALQHNLTILTPDSLIKNYPSIKVDW